MFIPMRLVALLFTASLVAVPAAAQNGQTSPAGAEISAASSAPQDAVPLQLPVSLDRIKAGLEHPPAHKLRGLDERPQFHVEVQQHLTLQELVSSLDVKAGPVPAGGLYASEQQRVLSPPVDNPLSQPYAAFSQPELLTVLIENLVGQYFAGRAIASVTAMERARAEAAAKAEVRQAVGEYCAQQPNHGAHITICTTSVP
jgi:hypothetical protein